MAFGGEAARCGFFRWDYGTCPVFIGTTGESFNGRVQGTVDEVSIFQPRAFIQRNRTIYAAGSAGKMHKQVLSHHHQLPAHQI